MKLLVTGAWKCTEEYLNKIKELGIEVFFLQNEKDSLPCDTTIIDGVICNNLFAFHEINEFTSLKYIQLTSAGLDRVPLDYIKEHDIKLYNAGGVYSIPMAEFAVSGILQIYKQAKFFMKNKENKVWEKNRNLLEIYDKNVCIVGCGNIGTECAKRLKAFGANIVGIDIFPKENEYYKNIYYINDLKNVLKDIDIIILTLPLTNDTIHLFNEEVFNMLKDDAVLVNISRGKIVDENALINALDNKLMGAVIDVFEEEPLNGNSALWDKENIIITPHNSFIGDGNNRRLSDLIIKNICEYK